MLIYVILKWHTLTRHPGSAHNIRRPFHHRPWRHSRHHREAERKPNSGFHSRSVGTSCHLRRALLSNERRRHGQLYGGSPRATLPRALPRCHHTSNYAHRRAGQPQLVDDGIPEPQACPQWNPGPMRMPQQAPSRDVHVHAVSCPRLPPTHRVSRVPPHPDPKYPSSTLLPSPLPLGQLGRSPLGGSRKVCVLLLLPSPVSAPAGQHHQCIIYSTHRDRAQQDSAQRRQ